MGLMGLHFEYSRESQRSDREGPVNERDLWQKERAFPKQKFPIEIFRNFLLMKNAQCPFNGFFLSFLYVCTGPYVPKGTLRHEWGSM